MKRILLLAGIAVFAATLIGCSKSEDDSSSNGPAANTQQAGPKKDAKTTENPAPKAGPTNSAKANQPAPTGATPTPVSDKDIEVGGKLGNK